VRFSPVAILSLVITLVGFLLGCIWSPGAALASIGTLSHSSVVGGLSLWFWILVVALSGQQVFPYQSRPRGAGATRNSQWFRDTNLEDPHRVYVPFGIYVALLLGSLVVTRFQGLPLSLDAVYGVVAMSSLALGFGIPGYLMGAR